MKFATIRPTGKHLLVSPVLAPKQVGTIHIPESFQGQYDLSDKRVFIVLAVGPKVDQEVEAGDRILCHSYTDGPLPLDDDTGRKLISSDQILAVIKAVNGTKEQQ